LYLKKPFAMKTQTCFSRSKAVFSLLLIIAGLLFASCERPILVSDDESDPDYVIDHNQVETYLVGFGGVSVAALDQLITLDIPENAFDDWTTLMIRPNATNQVESLLLMNSQVSVESDGSTIMKPIRITLKYDPCELQCSSTQEEMGLRIFTCVNKDPDNAEIEPEFDYVICGDNCEVDCVSKTLSADFTSLGTYVVGRRR